MRKLIESEEYQKFGRNQNINNGGRMVSPGEGDDAVLKEIREIFRKISLCFEEVLCRNLNDNVLKIALINFSDLINESKILTSAYVDILLKAST